MNIIENRKDHVKAIVRLYEFCSTKKFHLIDQISVEDEIGQLALKINNEISAAEGLNIFTAKDESELLKYEKILNSYNLNYVRKNFVYSPIGDDFAFLKRVHNASNEILKNYKIEIEQPAKDIIKGVYKITIPSFEAYLNSPSSVDVFAYPDDSSYQFIVNIKIKHPHREKILMVMLQSKGEQKISVKSAPHMKVSHGKSISGSLWVDGIFLVKMDPFQNYLNKPANLLLKLIELYGVPVKLGGISKKLFVDEYIDINEIKTFEDLDNKVREQLGIFGKKHELTGSLSGNRGKISDRITGYLIDFTKYKNDFIKGLV